jgi:hypothetical protein
LSTAKSVSVTARTRSAAAKNSASQASPTTKPAVKPAIKPISVAAPAAKPAKAMPVKAADSAAVPKTKPAKTKPVKVKPVRDSFTFPKNEYLVIDALKKRAVGLGHPAKKSELLRAGIKALAAMADAAFTAAIRQVPAIKTGRPGKA